METLAKLFIFLVIGGGAFWLGRHMSVNTFHHNVQFTVQPTADFGPKGPIDMVPPDRFGTRDAPTRADEQKQAKPNPPVPVASVPPVQCVDGACYYDVRRSPAARAQLKNVN